MLKRSKSSRRNHRSSNVVAKLIQQQRLDLNEDNNRCSDGDSSQSSRTAVQPLFASVHRTNRHVGLKRTNDGPTTNAQLQGSTAAMTMTTTTTTATTKTTTTTTTTMQMQRPTYQQYQQQRRTQHRNQQQQQQQHQQQQLQQQQQQQQQTYEIENVALPQKTAKGKSFVYERQQQKQNQMHSTYLNGNLMQANVVHNANGHCGNRNGDGVVLVSKSLNSEAKISRIPVQQVNMPQQTQQQQRHQQQQEQEQQLQQQRSSLTTFNQTSRSAPTCLNDIYERNSLNQTTFMAIEDKQRLTQGQQIHHQGKQIAKTSHPMWQQKHYKATHFLKLPAPPPLLPMTHQPIGAGYPHYFQFSEPYVEPMDSKNHFLNEPPPPAPLNHVYETIKERSPISPPLPDRLQTINNTLPPPLPPSRLLKKKITQPSSNQSRSHKTHRKSSTEKEAEKKGYSKMFALQPPAYIAPPALLISTNNSNTQGSTKQYNLQQRTKADGEQKSYIYQQLKEQKQQQQQQQQQQPQPQQKSNTLQSEVHEKLIKNPNMMQQKPSQQGMREHPVGANGEIKFPLISNEVLNNSNSNTNTNISNANNNSFVNDMTTATTMMTTMMMDGNEDCCQQFSVEHTLQQAGLLHNTNTVSGSIAGSTAVANGANNTNVRYQRPSALPIVFEEEAGEFQDVLVLEEDGTAKLPYRHGKIEVSLETAQAMAAAAYYARAAQKLAQGTSVKSSRTTDMSANSSTRNGGFCGALQRAPPPMPPGVARRLANKENYGLGKVKVMLRVADVHTDADNPHFMMVDKKKRQITLTDPAAISTVAVSTSQERGPMVAAPKMFAFDSLFTTDDQQSDVCASALSEVIPAVLEGSDGCLLTIGYPNSGQTKTMLGTVNPPSELGAIPCAISWLYKGINERRQKSGARFSVRVSALGVSATKPDSTPKDLLAAHATDSDDSPGVYLRDDFLGGPTELRAPTAERAALFLDAALTGRPQGSLEPAMIFTLHVYQYSLSRKGGVAGGRSRLHLIDLGACANRNGGLPLSGIGNILLAILSGQRHPPNKDHPLTPLLKDCLAPLTCHVAIMAHVMHTQSHTDALTTIQLASRIHRMRRRKHRFPLSGGGGGNGADKSGMNGLQSGLNGHQSTGSSAGSGADPSSSELSADTVIYMGPSDDATDGEHPPVYLPSLSSGDNRGVMSKALKGSGVEKQQPSPSKVPGAAKKLVNLKAPQSPVAQVRSGSFNRNLTNQQQPPNQVQPLPIPSASSNEQQPQFFSPVHSVKTLSHPNSSPLRHVGLTMMCSKGSNVPTPKGSPLRRPGVGGTNETLECSGSPMRQVSEEQWVDGPRISRAKVAEARHLLREVNHVKQCETWIDGPKSQSSRSLTAGNLPIAPSQIQGYGFMDSHKKSMIRQWVEYQTSQVFQTASAGSSPTHHHREQQAQHLRNITYHMAQLKQKSLDNPEDLYATSTRQLQPQSLQHQQQQLLLNNDQHLLRNSQLELINSIATGLTTGVSTTNTSAPAEIRGAQHYRQNSAQTHPPLGTHYISDNNFVNEETELHSTHSLHTAHTVGYGILNSHQMQQTQQQHYIPTTSASDTGHALHTLNSQTNAADCDEDQDSGPSEVPPALPLIEPLGSREISHESLHRILSRHVSRESLYQQQQQQQQELRRQEEHLAQQQQQHQLSRQSKTHYSQQSHSSSMGMSDCALQVTEEEIARTMAGGEHPLAALSHCENMSIVSSFHAAGDAFSDCAMGERTRNQFDQLARLREIFTSQLAMAEVTPVFRTGCDVGSVYSEPAYRFNTGPGSVCSEPPYRPPTPRQPSRSPSQGSVPSLNGIMQIAGMEQYASLRHPDGASDPNLPKLEKPFSSAEHDNICEVDEKSALLTNSKRPSFEPDEEQDDVVLTQLSTSLQLANQSQLPLLPLNTSSEAYDSGHDSSTPRTSKHSGISRRAESGYHSVATARDSDESSFTSGLSKEHHNRIIVKRKQKDKGLCTWLMNPFTCTYPETEGEVSDF